MYTHILSSNILKKTKKHVTIYYVYTYSNLNLYVTIKVLVQFRLCVTLEMYEYI